MSRSQTIPSRDEIISLAVERGALRPFPANALKLIQVVKDPNFSTDEMVAIIEREPAIAVQVLAAANSPLYGCSRQIDSISHAVVVLGINNVTQQVVYFATNDLYGQANAEASYADQLYKHSLGCALVARELTAIHETVDATDAFLHGLLHDIGKLIFSSVVPEYNQEFANKVGFPDIIAKEIELFGVSHQEIGNICVANWGFPDDMVSTIAHHHGSPESPLDSECSIIVEAANWIARVHGVGSAPDESAAGLCLWNPILTELKTEHHDRLVEVANEELRQLTSL